MAASSNAPLDLLWKEYSFVFAEFDDLTLARWSVQTLGQLTGKAWRFSHPLVGSYRLAAQLAHDRQVWLVVAFLVFGRIAFNFLENVIHIFNNCYFRFWICFMQ